MRLPFNLIQGAHFVFRLNVAVPDAWIIEEELRRERERKKKDQERSPLPFELPTNEDVPLEEPKSKHHPDHSNVIIVDL